MTRQTRGRLPTVCAGLAVVAAAVLLLVRAQSAISFAHPLLVVTSGAEEEGVMGILRAMDGAAYVDPFLSPFNATYYNWVFFYSYAAIIGGIKGALGLGVEWVPTIGRFLGLASVALCWTMSAMAMLRANPAAGPAARRHNQLLAAWLAIGPLTGWWAISLNPELWATAMSEASVVVMLAWYERRRLPAIILAGLLSVAAWSFKQSYVYMSLALALFLLLRWDWRGIIVLAVVHVLGVFPPLLLGSPEYRSIMLAWTGSDFALWQLWRNVLNVGSKTLPVLLGAALTVPLLLRWRDLRRDTPLLMAVCGVVATLPIIPASAKVGAAENYTFLQIFFLALLAARAVVRLEAAGWPRRPSLALAGTWAAEAVAVTLVVFGIGGFNSVRQMDAHYRAQRDCIAHLPAPMYSLDPYLQLPWMFPHGPRFVLAYQYFMERGHGRWFEHNGVGGLLNEGWFASIAAPATLGEAFDGGTFDRYERRPGECAGLKIYFRR